MCPDARGGREEEEEEMTENGPQGGRRFKGELYRYL